MPYIKRETYNKWCEWIKSTCEKINDLTAGNRNYGLAIRYYSKRVVLLDNNFDSVVAVGMKDITQFVMMLEKRYKV